MSAFWKRFGASYAVSLTAIYLSISIVAITGVWRNDFVHVTDNLLTALVLCVPNAFFGASWFRRIAVSAYFGLFTVAILVMIAFMYKNYLDELRLFWPIWVSMVITVAASLYAYPPCLALLERSLDKEGRNAAGP